MLWKPAVLKVILMAGACIASGAANFPAGSHGSHNSHGGGHSHGGDSHGGASRGGGHSLGRGFHRGRSNSGGRCLGGSSRLGSFSNGSSGDSRQGNAMSNARSGAFSSQQSRNSPFGRPATGAAANRATGGWSSGSIAGRGGSLSSNPANSYRPASSFEASRPLSNPVGYGSRSPSSSLTSRSVPGGVYRGGPRAGLSFDSDRPPEAQRNSFGAARNTASYSSPLRNTDAGRNATNVRNSVTNGVATGTAANAMWRGSLSDSSRPLSARSELGNMSGRPNSSRADSSHFALNRQRAGLGISYVHASGLRDSPFSQGRRAGFAGGRPLGRASLGFNGGSAFGNGADWFFGNLFGLALDLGRFSWPALGFAGLNLLDSAIQSSSWHPNPGFQSPEPALCPDLYSPGDFACTQ